MPELRQPSPLNRAVVAAVPPLRRLVAERNALIRRLRAAQVREETTVQENRELSALVGAQALEIADQSSGLGYLLIVTYGRSGSTLLQGILNSIPEYVIRGENRDALHSLFAYHDVIVKARDEHLRSEPLKPQHSWYGIDAYLPDLAVSGMRALVLRTLLRPDPDTRVVGFKEIRWWHKDWRAYVTFLRELFPGLRVVINTRNHENVAKSQWWAERENPLGMLERYERRLSEIEAVFGDDAYRLHYDDWVADPELLRGLFEWLGESFDRATIDAVMAVKHSH